LEKQALKQKFQLVLPHLGEKQQRIVLAAEAKALGHGGITVVAEAAGISRPVIYRDAWVSVGCGHDTAAFAVRTLRNWWRAMGSVAYPGADCLLICADGGGSNGYRTRLWTSEL